MLHPIVSRKNKPRQVQEGSQSVPQLTGATQKLPFTQALSGPARPTKNILDEMPTQQSDRNETLARILL
jgi:hypothetical protein